jgi:predicted RNA binding protein YcfA (HicA-like mRNA interferase family)
MRLPRDVSGTDLVKHLSKLGYFQTRQVGRHIRLTCEIPHQHHVTVPLHDSLRIGTLSAILNDVAVKHKIERDALIDLLFG